MNHQTDSKTQEAAELLAMYADVVPPEVLQEWRESGAESPEKPLTSEQAMRLLELLGDMWVLTDAQRHDRHTTKPFTDVNTATTSHHTNPDVP